MDEKRNDLYFNELIKILSEALNDQDFIENDFLKNLNYCRDIFRTYLALYKDLDDIEHFKNYVKDYLIEYEQFKSDKLSGIQDFINEKGSYLTAENKEMLKEYAIRGRIDKAPFLCSVSLDHVNEIKQYVNRYCYKCEYRTPITLDIDIRETLCKISEKDGIATYRDRNGYHRYIEQQEGNNKVWYELERSKKIPLNDKDIIDIVDPHGIFQKRLYFMNTEANLQCHTLIDSLDFEKIDLHRVGYSLPAFLLDDSFRQFPLSLVTQSFIFYIDENGEEVKMYRTENFELVSDNYFATEGFTEEILELYLQGKEYNLIYMDDSTRYGYKYILLDYKGEMNDETDLFLDLMYNDDLTNEEKSNIDKELRKLLSESESSYKLESLQFENDSSVSLYEKKIFNDHTREDQTIYTVISNQHKTSNMHYVGFNYSLAYETLQEIIYDNVNENRQIINAEDVLAMTSTYGENIYNTNMDIIIRNFYDIVGTNKIYILQAENLRYGQDGKPEYFAHQDGDKNFIQDLTNHINGTIMKNENNDLVLYTRDADFADDYLDGKYHMTMQRITIRLSPNQNTYEVIDADPETLFRNCNESDFLGDKIISILQEEISLDDEEIDL
ncbi:hypothetical protein SAMN05216507_11171 [[Clostridium] innocuum]|uniref:hypothetical protein n=1 Tax=Clostridium innocuum TaxID=1522 RepID=UPI0008E96E83|nr:hypothetical protein [[Clostridium] innocuum]SFL59026.1 hypothetical protein SAMN05216507_11171 [[Clostridium] innocuum]